MGEACFGCKGHKYRWDGAKRVPCYVCGGTGGTPIRFDERPKPGDLPMPPDPIRHPERYAR